MSATSPFEGVRPEQGPPLWVPLMFFVVAPVALAVGGLLWALEGSAAVTTRFAPVVQVSTHLITLGFLGAIMFGALYQMVPVVAGAPVPLPALSTLALALLGAGTGALAVAFFGGPAEVFVGAAGLLSVAGSLLVAPLGIALVRAPTRSPTVWGMRAALLGFVALATLGVAMAWVRSGASLPIAWTSTLSTHVALGAIVWVGGLISAVSWQVLPMFYVAPPLPVNLQRGLVAVLATTLAAAVVGLTFELDARPLTWIYLLLAAPILVVQPVLWATQLRRRRRRRRDASLEFWFAACATGPLAWSLAGCAAFSADPRWTLLAAWTFLFGWAGLIAHGMLTRIVPFLVWFHRVASSADPSKHPPMRRLWPDGRVRWGSWLHLLTWATGVAAIAGRSDVIVRVAGVGLVATAAVVGLGVIRAVRG